MSVIYLLSAYCIIIAPVEELDGFCVADWAGVGAVVDVLIASEELSDSLAELPSVFVVGAVEGVLLFVGDSVSALDELDGDVLDCGADEDKDAFW